MPSFILKIEYMLDICYKNHQYWMPICHLKNILKSVKTWNYSKKVLKLPENFSNDRVKQKKFWRLERIAPHATVKFSSCRCMFLIHNGFKIKSRVAFLLLMHLHFQEIFLTYFEAQTEFSKAWDTQPERTSKIRGFELHQKDLRYADLLRFLQILPTSCSFMRQGFFQEPKNGVTPKKYWSACSS